MTPVMRVFIPAPPVTGLDLPHIALSPDAREIVMRFCDAVEGREPGFEDYRGFETKKTYHVDLADSGVWRSGLWDKLWPVVYGFYEYRLPPGDAAILTGLPARRELLFFLAWLRSALIFLSGEPLVAHMIPAGATGIGRNRDDVFPLHSDRWHTELLLNVVNEVRPGGETLLLPVERALEIAAELGRSPEEIATMRAELHDAQYKSGFRGFNRLIMSSNELAQRIAEALIEDASCVALKPGQGYLVNDRRWLHGRHAVQGGDRTHRLYRFGYNNSEIMGRLAAEGFDWGKIGPSGGVGE